MRKSLIASLREEADEIHADILDEVEEARNMRLVEMLRIAARRLELYHDRTLFGDTDG